MHCSKVELNKFSLFFESIDDYGPYKLTEWRDVTLKGSWDRYPQLTSHIDFGHQWYTVRTDIET